MLLVSNSFGGGTSSLSSEPALGLVAVLVVMPAAALAGYVLGGREPPPLGRQPLE